MIGYYNYTVWATYLSVISALTGTLFASHGNISFAVLCLVFCGGLDMIDGKIASTKKNRTEEEKKFGIQIDSLSDLVAFGILPSRICVEMLGDDILVRIFSFIYVLCALIRLAYFNVSEETRQSIEQTRRKNYEGLPVTSAAISLPLFYVVGLFVNGADKILPFVFLVVSAFLFILPFRLKKPGNREMILLAVAGTMIIAAMLIKIIR